MITVEDVKAFLDQFNIKAQIFGIHFRDDRQKNEDTLRLLNITPFQRELIVKSLLASRLCGRSRDRFVEHGKGNVGVWQGCERTRSVYQNHAGL